LADVPKAIFAYLRDRDVEDLHAAATGYRTAPLGSERFIELDQLLAWSRPVTSALDKAAKADLVAVERDAKTLDAGTKTWLERFNDTWCARSQAGRELRFLNRPLRLDAEPGRLFVLSRKRAPFGFLTLDPYRAPGGRGYLLNLVRFAPTKQWGVYPALVAQIAERLRDEGAAELSLGCAPLDFEASGPQPLSTTLQMRIASSVGARAWRLEGLRAAKTMFESQLQMRHIAVKGRSAIRAGFTIAQVMGLAPWTRLAPR